jgi:hypothetical protein
MTPIGYYKTQNIIFDNPIPPQYADYYSVVGVNVDGTLEFAGYDKRYNYDQVLACGPALCVDGNAIFDDDVMLTKGDDDDVFLFLSKFMAGDFERININGVDGLISNANNIMPGELKHGGNPNPRTILGIDRDNNVFMIKIEGRDDRGTGMDFVQMGKLCELLGLYYAINLDGGASSRMCWKEPGKMVINVAGADASSYPVGGVLAFSK